MLRDLFSDRAMKALTPQTVKQLTKSIMQYVDENSEILLTLNMTTRYSFADSHRLLIFNSIDVSENEITAYIKGNKKIHATNRNHNNPFYYACLLAVHILVRKKDNESAKLVLTYMSMMMYTSIHKGLYKYNANPRIMEYTLADLDKSFQIRQMSSIFEFIDSNAKTVFETYTDRIKRLDDADIVWVIDATHTRLKGKMVKIANMYYDNYESGNYLNLDTEVYGTEERHDVDNNSYAVDRLSGKIYIKLLNGQYDKKFIKYSISSANTSEQKVKNLIEDIIGADDSAKELIQAIIMCYLTMSGKSIDYVSKGDFITFMKRIYTSNTDSPYMATIKSILDTWLDENSVVLGRANYSKTSRSNYRKALYMFFVFVINRESKIS